MAFTTIVLGNLGLILANRSQTRSLFMTLRFPNRALYWIIGGTLTGLLIALYVPSVSQLFRFAPPPHRCERPRPFALCLGAAIAGLVWYELYKLLRTPS